MKKRVISAIVALIIVIPIIIVGSYAYYVGVGILAVIAYREMLSVREREKTINPLVKVLTLVSYLMILLSAVNKKSFNIDYRLFILDLFICLLPLIVLNKKDYDAEDALVLVAVTMFLGIAFNFLIIIRNMNVLYLVYVVLITIMSDTFAHFFGTKIGKYKLCPAVSPFKTVEGMIGGVAFGTFIGTVFFITFIDTTSSVFYVSVISLALSLIAEFGDLVFSAIKRRYNVKDYGNIMPGHGGVLDRLDSILFAILAFSYLVSFF